MADLLDSGERREFGNGAVRDVADGKGRCDLLPLKILGDFFTRDGKPNEIFYLIENYVRSGDTKELFRAMDEFNEWHWKNNRTMFLEVAKQYEDGARKYADRNWEKGIPVHVFIDSGVRHYLKFLRGDTDEPHDRAFIWNMLGAIWTHENKPELIDLPFAGKTTTSDDLDMGEESVDEPQEAVKGKYEGLSDRDIVNLMCYATVEGCHKCPIPNWAGSGKTKFDSGCAAWIRDNPEEFRAIAIKWLREKEESNGH